MNKEWLGFRGQAMDKLVNSEAARQTPISSIVRSLKKCNEELYYEDCVE